MIQKFNQYNESLRDQMTGKSEEELDLAYKNVINDSTRLDKYTGKLSYIFREISNLMNEPLDNLYYLDEEEESVDELWDYFADYLEDTNTKPIKVNSDKIIHGQWYCYPHKKFAWWGYGTDDVLGWVFTKDLFNNAVQNSNN